MATNEKYSYSKVDCYRQCPFKFKLKYIDKHFVPVSAIALDVGNLIHETEECIANAIKDGKPIDYVALKNRIVLKMAELEHKFPVEFYEADKVGRYYKDKLYGYLEKGIYRFEEYMKQHPTYEIVGAEVPFKVTIHSKLFTGKIDRLLRDTATGKYVCHDLKTYPVEVEPADLKTPLQFVVYTLAIKDMFSVNNEDVACGYDLPFCDVIQQAGKGDFISVGSAEIKKLLDAIDSGEYEPNPTPLCHWCEFCATNPRQPKEGKNLCPYHSLWTRENKVFITASEWLGLDNHAQVLESYVKRQSR